MAIQKSVLISPVLIEGLTPSKTLIGWFFLCIFLSLIGETIGALVFTILVLPFLLMFGGLINPLYVQLRHSLSSRVEKCKKQTIEKFKEFIGNPRYVDTNVAYRRTKKVSDFCICGTGIGYDEKYIYIMDFGTVARLTWDSIRSWRYEVSGYENRTADNYSLIASGSPEAVAIGVGANIGLNIASSIQASTTNAVAKANAIMASGFFINVSDIEQPEWQFMCDDINVLKKWFEVFQQINEGKLPIINTES